jgi:hypothetical protein
MSHAVVCEEGWRFRKEQRPCWRTIVPTTNSENSRGPPPSKHKAYVRATELL